MLLEQQKLLHTGIYRSYANTNTLRKTPENIFTGANGNVNIACASGLSYPIEYIQKLGKEAITEQKNRMEKRKSLSLLEDLEDVDTPVMPEVKTKSKRKQISFDMLQELD